MAQWYSPYLRNWRLDGQSAVIRPGHSLFDTLAAGSYPKGIGLYLRPTVADQRIVVRHNIDSTHKLYLIDEDANNTSILTNSDITSNNRMWFQPNADVVYCMNGSDTLGILSWTTYTTYAAWIIGFIITPTSWTLVQWETVTGGTSSAQWLLRYKNNDRVVVSVGNGAFQEWETITWWTSGATATISLVPFAPAFSAVFNSCMRVSGWQHTPNLVFKSAADNYIEFTFIGWGDIFQFQETVTWLSATNQALFYFTQNTISVTGQNDIQVTSDSAWAQTISYTTRSLQVKEWAANNNCIVESGNEVYFLSSSNNISKIATGQNVYGFEVIPLSQRSNEWISVLMSTLNKDQSTAFWYLLPTFNLIKRYFVTEDGTFNDISVVYDTVKDKFLVDNNCYFFDGVFMPTWGKYYTVSMIEPKVYLDEYWQDDEDSPIPAEYRTKEFYIADPTYTKILWETRTLLDLNELAELIQEIWIDRWLEDTKTIYWTDITTVREWWIGTEDIGEFAVGDDWPDDESNPSDYTETYILRTKWNLNKKWRKFQFRFINNSVAGKVRLKTIFIKAEVCPPEATALTP